MAEDDPTPIGTPKPISDEDLRMAFSGPAPLITRAFITKMGGGVRLSFLEENPGKVPAIFRAAVFLQYPDALALRDLLIRNLKDIQEMFEEAAEPAPEMTSKDGE